MGLERGTKITRCRDELIGYMFGVCVCTCARACVYVCGGEGHVHTKGCVEVRGQVQVSFLTSMLFEQGLLFAPVQAMLHPIPS